MQKQKGISSLLIILIVVGLVIVAGGGVFAYQYFVTQQVKPTGCTEEAKVCPNGSTVSRTEPNCEFASCPTSVKDNYSFKAVTDSSGVLAGKQQHSDYFVEIYKNNTLVKSISIANTHAEPKFFTVSPDQKYVAFWTAAGGGTCVYIEFPTVIDLSNFSIINLDSSDINKKLSNALGIDVNKNAIKFDAPWQLLKTIKWVSNNKIEASMTFGNEGCHIEWVGKPADAPNTINANVDFTIIK